MTASDPMTALVDAALHVAVDAGPAPAKTRAALLDAIGEIERDRDAQAAEVQRLAGVAREACDIIDDGLAYCSDCDRGRRADDIRASIPTPDPAAFVAAVDRLMESVRVYESAGPGFGSQARDEVIKDRAALLALGGVR